MSKTIALLITLDTKGEEAGFIKEQIEARGHKALLFDIGVYLTVIGTLVIMFTALGETQLEED